MTREQWIDYYESINGHKPSVLEVALFIVNIILTIFFFFVRITGLIFFLSR